MVIICYKDILVLYNKFLLTYELNKSKSAIDILNDFSKQTGLVIESQFIPDLLSFIEQSKELDFALIMISAESAGIIPEINSKLKVDAQQKQ